MAALTLKSFTAALGAASLLMASGVAEAKPQFCAGRINDVLVQANGNVMIRSTWLRDFQQICNTESDWKGVSPSICANWLDLARTAVTTNKPVTIHIEAPACDSILLYDSAPPPNYLMLQTG